MNTILLLVSLAFAALAVFLARRNKPDAPPSEPNGLLAFLGVTALLVVAVALAAPRDQLLLIGAALLLGFTAAALAAWLRLPGFAAFPVGVAAAAVAAYLPDARFAVLVSLGLGALLLTSDAAGYAALGAAAAMAADALGPKAGTTPALAHSGTMIAVGVVLVALVVTAAKGTVGPKLTPALTAVLAAAVGAALVSRVLLVGDDMLVVVAAAVAALIVHWLLIDSEDSLRIGVSAVIWIGLGIVSFGLGRGVGITLALIVAAGILAALGSRSGLLSLAPLIGMALYRVMRDAQPVAPPALEATQYNALVGLTVGAILPLLPTDWLALEHPPAKRTVGLALWAVLLTAVPVTTLIVVGSRGVVGLLLGLGLAGILVAIRGIRSLVPLGVAIGLSGVAMSTFGWLQPLTAMERDRKIVVLAAIAAAIVVLGTALAAITPSPSVREEAAR